VPFDDLTPDSSAARSLSEQLRDLEVQLGHENELSLPPLARRTRLPTHLGRPIGITRAEAFPRIPPLNAEPEARLEPEPPPSTRAKIRRGVTVAGVGLLLLASTAIVPPLLLAHRPLPVATQAPIPDQLVTSPRTERFAHSAQELRDATTPPAQARAILARQLVAPQPVPPRPTSHFEPTAAEGQAEPDPMIIVPPPVR
jgi:hypothetical protein